MAFAQRYLLGWINDNSPVPLVGQRWPIIDVDERTVQTYRHWLQVAKDAGYNGVTLWGMFVSHAWPVPLESCLPPVRRRVLEQIIAEADRLGIAVLTGLGVYSWGFEQIIAHDRSTARNEGRRTWGNTVPDNGVAMCYHSESARQWMRQVIDFCAGHLDTHGFGMQSGDLGRCFCSECRKFGDLEYHARILDETASYVRDRYPGQTLGISAWGIDIGGSAGLPQLRRMTRNVDFLTDVTDQVGRGDLETRRRTIAALPCSFGSLGGMVVVPPQRWERDRWFLPHAALTAEKIRKLDADGGKAFEFFMGPLNSPHYSLMTRLVGRLLQHPPADLHVIMGEVVNELYEPASAVTREGLIQWLLDVEISYFGRLPGEVSGEFDFEPLVGDQPGPPIYLQRLTPEGRQAFAADLDQLAARLAPLANNCRRPADLATLARCLAHMRGDLHAVG